MLTVKKMKEILADLPDDCRVYTDGGGIEPIFIDTPDGEMTIDTDDAEDDDKDDTDDQPH